MNRYQAVTSALRTHLAASVRSEDLEHFDRLFVEPVDTATIITNNNQLVYGRRGSGKTILLGALTERINNDSYRVRVAALRFTATDFYSSPDIYGLASPHEKTHLLFHGFIERLCGEIADLADSILRKPRWFERITLDGQDVSQRRNMLEDKVLELLEVASYGVEAPFPNTIERSEREQRKDERKVKRQAGISVDLKTGASPSGSLNASRAAHQDVSDEVVEEVLRRPTRRFAPRRVKDLIGEIVDLFGLEYLIIFIDEWMSLSESQVDFAERLRQSLFGDRRIAVKIAADQFQGQFNNSGRGHNFRGLDIGGDIFVAVDLDRPFRDPQNQGRLFAEALYNRLTFFEHELIEHFGPRPLSNHGRFVDTIFSTEQAYAELCHGSHGLVRDFHEILAVCFKGQGGQVTSGNRIDTESVRSAILKRNDAIYNRAVHSTSANEMLFKVIAPHVRTSKSRFFIVESRPGAHTAIVKDMLTKRIIHNVPGELVHPSIRGEYDCFEVSYGIYLDLIRALEFSTGEDIDDSYRPAEIASITSTSKTNYLLDIDPFEGFEENADTLLCPHCDTEFPSTAKSYRVRRICPFCYLDQDIDRNAGEEVDA